MNINHICRQAKGLLNKMMPKNKKGQLVGTVSNLITSLAILVVVIIILLAIVFSVVDGGLFTTGSAHYNTTQAIANNFTAIPTTFFSSGSTIGNALFIVLLVGVFAIVLFVVKQFSDNNSAAGTSGGL